MEEGEDGAGVEPVCLRAQDAGGGGRRGEHREDLQRCGDSELAGEHGIGVPGSIDAVDSHSDFVWAQDVQIWKQIVQGLTFSFLKLFGDLLHFAACYFDFLILFC